MRIVSNKFISAFAVFSLTFLIAGCSSNSPETRQTPVSTISSNPTSPTPTPQNQSTTPTIEGIPVDFNCEQLITTADLYAYNPNLTTFAPPAITTGPMGAISEAKGEICGYKNLSSGIEILVGIAKVTESSVPTIAALISSNQNSKANIPNLDLTVFYSSEGTSGVSQLIKGQYWVAISSPEFNKAEDSIEILMLVLNKLP